MRVIVAALDDDLRAAKAALIRGRDQGEEAIWLGHTCIEAVSAAALQEAADEVWVTASGQGNELLLKALQGVGLVDVQVRLIQGTSQLKGD